MIHTYVHSFLFSSPWRDKTILADKLKFYQKYVDNYDTTMSVYTRCLKDSPAFVKFIEDNRAIKEVANRDLLSFLIMPIQRIPRYILLLDDLKKHTPDDLPDKQNIQKGYAKMKEIADYLNTSKKKSETQAKMAQLQQNLVVPENVSLTLSKDGRTFIKESSVIVKKGSASDYAYLFLLSDLLLYTKQKQKKFKLKATIPLSKSVLVEELPDTKFAKNCFRITAPSLKDGPLVVNTTTPAEKQIWLTELRKSIQAAKA